MKKKKIPKYIAKFEIPNGMYRTISAKEAAKIKAEKPEIWKRIKGNLYWFDDDLDIRCRLDLTSRKSKKTGKTSYFFRYHSILPYINRANKSEIHTLLQEVIYTLTMIVFCAGEWAPLNERITLFDVEIGKEKRVNMSAESYIIADLFLKFKYSNPGIYGELMGNQLIIEILNTHAVDYRKRKKCRESGITILEVDVQNLFRKVFNEPNMDLSEPATRKRVFNRLKKLLNPKNGGYIGGSLVTGPIIKD